MNQIIMPEDYTILLVDDDIYISEMVHLYLKSKGFNVLLAFTGLEALSLFKEHSPHLVILDIMLPEMDGWEVCRRIREVNNLPVLMLTAKSESEEKLNGFNLGADDYLVKPFDPNELIARVMSLLRRSYTIEKINKPASMIQYGNLKLDQASFMVTAGEKIVDLTPREYQLLLVFVKHPNQVLGRQHLLDLVWGEDYLGEDRVVDVFVTRLRQKLLSNHSGWKIETIRGFGYRFTVEE